jgi:protein TonB
MGHRYLLTDRRVVRGKARCCSALGLSLAFHVVVGAVLLSLCFLYRPQPLVIRNGSMSGGPMISLQTIMIVPSMPPPTPVATPVQTPTPLPAKITPTIAGNSVPQPTYPVPTHAAPPETGAPILAATTAKPAPAAKAKTELPGQKIASASVTGTGIKHLRPASDKYVSSYAPGESIFPHPPYPPEARDLQQTGIVRMMIHFDTKGDVVEAKIAQSSGVAILDAETQTYISEHWHSVAYAGQSVSVPVEYTLTSL